MKNKKKKIIKIIGISILAFLIIVIGGFLFYVSDYYKAEPYVIEVMEELEETEKIVVKDRLTILYTDELSEIGLIFYPGAKVEAISYLPILDKLREEGITCVLIEMPFHMAIFDTAAANEVFTELPEIKTWYICGHSMGGAMASSYFSDNKDKVEGLILLGAYIYGEVSPNDALTIYGTFNSNLEKNINYTENIVIIEGGNHAQFGNYGKQKGDPDATISSEEQQNITVEEIVEFIKNR